MIIDAYFRRLVEIMAAERTSERPEMFDDCVQEGLIAAWRAMEGHPGKPDAYYRSAARNGILNHLRGRATFGHESMQGNRDATTAQVPLLAVGSDGVEYLVTEPAYEAPYDALDVKQAVRDAVVALDDAERYLIWSRFWEDKSYPEIAADLQTRVNRLQWLFTTSAREKLRDSLDHVVAA